MCTVNDTIRKECTNKIEKLNIELESEIKKFYDINKACSDMEELIDNTQCVINNISECNFGGDKILDSIKTSEQGYIDRRDFYHKYRIECQKAIEQITEEINATIEFKFYLPVNCGNCDECRSNPNPNNSVEENKT